MTTMETRLKLILLLVSSTLLLFIRSIPVGVIGFVIIVCLNIIIGRRFRIWQRIVPFLFVSAMILIFQLLFNTGIDIRMRLSVGILAGLKLMSLSLMVFWFTSSVSLSAIVDALSFLPKQITLMVTISFSLLPAILSEIRAIRVAQEARGLKKNPFNPLSTLLPVVIPLLYRTLRRAEHVAIMLETRGFENSTT